jgi:biofilm protein TabA
MTFRAGRSAEENRIMTGNLKDWQKLKGAKGLEAGFRFLEGPDLAALPLGRHDIDGDVVYALLQRATTRPPVDGRFESHDRYIDIQFLIEGDEVIGLAPAATLQVATPYDAGKDITFYANPPQFEQVPLKPGQFAVFFPADGHMPLCSVGPPMEIHKAVVKVKLEYWKRLQD